MEQVVIWKSFGLDFVRACKWAYSIQHTLGDREAGQQVWWLIFIVQDWQMFRGLVKHISGYKDGGVSREIDM
jgi:hypothetical protein